MPVTHDGISCPLPLRPVALVVGLVLVGAGAWLINAVSVVAGVAMVVAGLLALLNQKGTRRVRVIHNKLLVEDERLLTALLIGPTRNRIPWEEVREVRIEGRSLRLETAGAPFITAEGATVADLAALKASVEATRAKARAAAGDGISG